MHYPRVIFAASLHERHAFQPGRAVATRWPIAVILTVRRGPQIGPFVVRTAKVAVINQARRPFSFYVEPSQSVRQICIVIDAYRNVAVPLRRTGNIANRISMGALDAPSEQAGDRIVAQRLFQPL